MKKNRNSAKEESLLLHETRDRRLFPNVPDPSGRRSNASRRNNHEGENRPEYAEFAGQRYEVSVDVAVSLEGKVFHGKSENFSQTGILVHMPETADISVMEGKTVTLDFRLKEGDLQEGTEMHYRRMKAKVVRVLPALPALPAACASS